MLKILDRYIVKQYLQTFFFRGVSVYTHRLRD
jgi:hypothetical protein